MTAFDRLAPPLFIFIWATGYIVAKLAAPHADPLTFLCWRYAGVVALMLALALAARAPWPSRRDTLHLAVAGLGIQALYLAGVWVSIRQGLPAGTAAHAAVVPERPGQRSPERLNRRCVVNPNLMDCWFGSSLVELYFRELATEGQQEPLTARHRAAPTAAWRMPAAAWRHLGSLLVRASLRLRATHTITGKRSGSVAPGESSALA